MNFSLEMVAGLFNFAVLVGVLVWVSRRSIASVLQIRSEQIRGVVSEAQKLAAEATTYLKRWSGLWGGREEEISVLKADAQATLAKFQKETQAKAEKDVERIERESTLSIQTERERAFGGLLREQVAHSIHTARAYLRSHLTEKDQSQLFQEYVERLANGSS